MREIGRSGLDMRVLKLLERCQNLLDEIVVYLEDFEINDESLQDLVKQAKQLSTEITNVHTSSIPSLHVEPSLYKEFVSFVLGDTERVILETVGRHGYGRLMDVERSMEKATPQHLRRAWRRLHWLGLLYGKEYSYLTSRGASAYRILTGYEPRPAKKDGRRHDPASPEQCVRELMPKLMYRLPLSNGASLLLKLLGNSRIYSLNDLFKHPACKVLFDTRDEFNKSVEELSRRRLLNVDSNGHLLLTPLGRLVWNIAFSDDRKSRDRPREPEAKDWITDIVNHFQNEGFRVIRRNEQEGVQLANGRTLYYDLWLIRDRRKVGVLFPPVPDPDAERIFYDTLTDISRTQEEVYIIGPTWKSVERTKQIVFKWIANNRQNIKREFIVKIASVTSLKHNKIDELRVRPRFKN